MLDARYSDRPPVAISPTLRLLRRGATSLFDTVRPAADPKGTASSEPDPALEAIFARNIRSISAINRQRGVRTIWIGEVFNEAPPPDVGPHPMWTPYIDLKTSHRLLAHLRGVLKHEAAALGDVHVDVDRSQFDNSHFLDGEHFSAKGARGVRGDDRPRHRRSLQPARMKGPPLPRKSGTAGLQTSSRPTEPSPRMPPNRLCGRLPGP